MKHNTKLWFLAVLPFAGVGIFTAASPTEAQDQLGGVLLRLDLSQRLQANDNADLAPVSQGTTIDATTGLGLSLSSRTRSSSIDISGSSGLRGRNAPSASSWEFERDDIRFGLQYSRFSKTSALDLNASYTSSDISFLNPFTLLEQDETLPLDFEDLRGSGTRRSLSFGSKLTLGRDAPFGLTLTANHRDLGYDNATATNLNDSSRSEVGATARFNFTPVFQGNLGLRYALFQESGSADRTTVELDVGATFIRPNGTMGISVSPAKTEEGIRIGNSLFRNFTLPGGELSTQIGITQSAASDVFMTGGFTYTKALPRGKISASLNRSVTSTTSDIETIRTVASLTTAQTLTPRVSLNLGVNLAQSKETLTGKATDIASLRAGIDYALTEDWALNASYRHEFRDETVAGNSNANIISFGLSRSFDFRY